MVVGVCNYLRKLNCKDSVNRKLFCSLIFEIFVVDRRTLIWLINKLVRKKTTLENWLRKYILTSSIPETRGRKNLPAETRQKMLIVFLNLECIYSTCDNCEMKKMYSDDELEIPEYVTFYQFVVEEYTFHDKSDAK